MWNQVSQSGPNQVVLRDVQRHLSGKYRCEVSADAPSFHTRIVSSWMHVVCKYIQYLSTVKNVFLYTSGMSPTIRAICNKKWRISISNSFQLKPFAWIMFAFYYKYELILEKQLHMLLSEFRVLISIISFIIRKVQCVTMLSTEMFGD